MTAISVSERLLEMAAFYTPLALTVTKRQRHRANGSLTSNLYRLTAAKKSQPPAKGGL